ncbi:MAG: isoprenylcysteine carboxylmethyltransferase family protein [Gammaproteobacteria bacterium]|jgi:protein-S-isoprenylcysteine O-methyltransferase Ste14
MLKRIGVLLYGTISYSLFLGTFLYAVGFIGNFGVPRTIDSEPLVPLGTALMVNFLLLGAFAVQHSVMARPVFKRWFTRIVPRQIERSTYVLLSSLLLIALFVFWQPMGGIIWQVTDPVAQGVLYAVFGLGWLIVLVATFLINHFDLFGLRQVWLYFRGKPYSPLKFGTPWLYRYMRHPLYVGWLLAFWATPTMTAAHLFFAAVTTLYILVAIQLEERDLISEHGQSYANYRKQVPMLIPSHRRRIKQGAIAAQSAG